MRALMIVALIGLLLPAPVGAQEEQSRVVQGCIAAIEAMDGREPDPINVVEDFAELEPPRARIRYGEPWQTSVACVFENRESPLTLQEVCFDMQCFSDSKSSMRFEEINLLLERAGY
jgi:hypothetical protein